MAKRFVRYHPAIPDLYPDQVDKFKETFEQLCAVPDSCYWDSKDYRYKALPNNNAGVALKFQHLFMGYIMGQLVLPESAPEIPRFPVSLKETWTGEDVRRWIDANVIPFLRANSTEATTGPKLFPE